MNTSLPKPSCLSPAAFGMDPGVFFSSYTLLSVHVWLIIHRLGSKRDRDTKEFRQRFYQVGAGEGIVVEDQL